VQDSDNVWPALKVGNSPVSAWLTAPVNERVIDAVMATVSLPESGPHKMVPSPIRTMNRFRLFITPYFW
jgi:hypothetical protein